MRATTIPVQRLKVWSSIPRNRRPSCIAAPRQVAVLPLDELVEGRADVVKIDVEGAEIDVLEGMTRLLRSPPKALIVEWHPVLQAMAGYRPDELPHWFLGRGWRLLAASHTSTRELTAADVPRTTAGLLRSGRPVELLAEPTARS
jgi:hypothetical protein